LTAERDAPDRDLGHWMAARRAEIEGLLEARLPSQAGAVGAIGAVDPGRLAEAVRYSLLAPGKRLRPLLALAAAEATGARLDMRSAWPARRSSWCTVTR
jgi:geranylgeranyl pyrophosphate synthase